MMGTPFLTFTVRKKRTLNQQHVLPARMSVSTLIKMVKVNELTFVSAERQSMMCNP